MNFRPAESDVVKFLRAALAERARAVTRLEVQARAAGLLGEHQPITRAKRFQQAKRHLGIRSVRNGFGSQGRWLWVLKAERRLRERRFPLEWEVGVGCLEYDRPPADVPSPRWRRFIDDCHSFLAAPGTGAERAAQLGWNAQALFACHRTRPLMYLGTAGLLWAINGGRLVNMYRDWAVIEGPADGSRRVFHRRQMDAANVTLPWIGPRRLRIRSPGRTPAS